MEISEIHDRHPNSPLPRVLSPTHHKYWHNLLSRLHPHSLYLLLQKDTSPVSIHRLTDLHFLPRFHHTLFGQAKNALQWHSPCDNNQGAWFYPGSTDQNLLRKDLL